jgi:formylglycine-generating enzyme required for sulfatase activity
VGSYKPNAFGLYDMHGNVWQWCHDWFNANYYSRSPGKDPPGPATGRLHVLRGGSWNWNASYCRCAYRGRIGPGNRENEFGFRVACQLP